MNVFVCYFQLFYTLETRVYIIQLVCVGSYSYQFSSFSSVFSQFFFKYVGASNIDYCILCNLDLLHFYWYLTENLY